ncbi:MAG: hypothetical protein LBN95_05700 [Prevotellaceae bacterium]|jgi:hypothetical protein|nr:hypothetical protein [Prevotellaceae bacterium]
MKQLLKNILLFAIVIFFVSCKKPNCDCEQPTTQNTPPAVYVSGGSGLTVVLKDTVQINMVVGLGQPHNLLFISDKKDVFVATTSSLESYIYKNGILIYAFSGGTSGLFVKGNDIYSAGGNSNSTAKVRKNGEILYSVETTGSVCSAISSITVIDNDIYTAGWEYVNSYDPNQEPYKIKIWKNDKTLYTITEENRNITATSIAISGNDIYVAGGDERFLAVWKNGEKLYRLNNGVSESSGVIVSHNNDVYVGGYMGRTAVIWKNGNILYEFSDAQIYSISISEEGDIYSTGIVFLGGHDTKSYVWKNGTVLYELNLYRPNAIVYK